MEDKEVMIEELNKLKESIKKLQTVRNIGMTPITYLGISLIVLKVANLVTWSWWLVLIPFYVPYAITLALAIPLTKKLYSYAKEITALREKVIKEGVEKAVEEDTTEVVTIPIVIELTKKETEDSNPGEFKTTTVTTETTEKPKKVKKKNKKKGEDNGEGTKVTTEESGGTEGTSTSNN